MVKKLMDRNKMKLHVTSDLHLDHYADYGKSILKYFDATSIDALIVAGDLMDGSHDRLSERTESIKKLCELYPYVFMVMGNHDYYGSSFKEVADQNKEYQEMFPNLVILEPGMNYIHEDTGLKIAGGTLWYPDSNVVQKLKGGWPDFRFIKYGKTQIFEDNIKFRSHLNDLADTWKPDIVISHMVPTPLGIHSEYKDSEYNCFFVSDETELIKKIQPKLWIFGHTHFPFDFKIGNTRLYCNPGTYPNENTNPNFKYRMEIEV